LPRGVSGPTGVLREAKSKDEAARLFYIRPTREPDFGSLQDFRNLQIGQDLAALFLHCGLGGHP
jgi:hypothetical protein